MKKHRAWEIVKMLKGEQEPEQEPEREPKREKKKERECERERSRTARNLQASIFAFDEGYGTAYERFAFNKFASRMVRKYNISTVLEIPADGIMGIPGIKSMIFACVGCEVTVAHPSKELLKMSREIWNALGLDANFVRAYWKDAGFRENSFDLVWNFCVIEHIDAEEVVREMLCISKNLIFMEIQNVFNIGFPMHRLYHYLRKEPWDHGNPLKMNISYIKRILNRLNADIVEVGATDMPPWPDINMKISESGEKNEKDWGNIGNEIRPNVRLKCLEEILYELEALQRTKLRFKERLVLLMFDIWHKFVESKMPTPLKIFFAHHPYVIARKRRNSE